MAATFPTSPSNGDQATVNGITYVYASSTKSWTRVPGSAGGGTPGGSDTYVQFNDNGVFNGTAGFTFNKTSNAIATSGTFNATGNITASGNIQGSYLLGNAYYVTGLSPTKIYNGTSEINIGTTNGNANISINGTSNVVVVASTGITVTGTIGSSGNITTTGANGVANIGAVGAYFNTVHAKATSAQYADVAEYYASDANYEPGTVVSFGGESEVTICYKIGDNAVAGVVSTNPAYIMNAGIESNYSVPVALTGRVPTKVLGPVSKGNMMISAGNGYARACATPTIGTVIGKSIENFNGTEGMIEIVVGRV